MSEQEQLILKSTHAAAGVMQKILYFPLTRIVLGCMVCLLVSFTANLFLKSILGLLNLDEDVAKMIRVSLNFASMLATYYWLFKYYEKREVSELALRYLPKEGLFGLCAAALVISLVILILYIMGYYKPTSINSDVFIQLYSFTIIATMAAAEEILMRGILYRITEASLGINIALIVSGLVFGIAHIGNENATWLSVISVGLYGIIPGVTFSLTKRLWYPIFLHVGWNFAQAFYGTVLSGMEEYSSYGFFQSKMQGPELLTGGTFGPENSIITIALTLLLFVGLYYRILKNKTKVMG